MTAGTVQYNLSSTCLCSDFWLKIKKEALKKKMHAWLNSHIGKKIKPLPNFFPEFSFHYILQLRWSASLTFPGTPVNMSCLHEIFEIFFPEIPGTNTVPLNSRLMDHFPLMVTELLFSVSSFAHVSQVFCLITNVRKYKITSSTLSCSVLLFCVVVCSRVLFAPFDWSYNWK